MYIQYPHQAGLKNISGHGGIRTYDLWKINKGRTFESQRGHAYFSSLFGLDIHSEVTSHKHSAFFKEFSLGGGGGQNRGKMQNEKCEPSRFGERASLKRDFVKL